MPPTAIRRPVTIAVWTALSTVALLFSPLWLGLAAVAQALSGRRQPMVLARLLIAYFARELVAMGACAGLWLFSGAGVHLRSRRFQALHWRLLRWFVHGLAVTAVRMLEIDVASEADPGAEAAMARDDPVIVLSRHAGPGDTILVVDQLISRYARRPSVVFKEELTIDPCVDLIAHRLPHAVLDTSDREECEKKIQETAAGLGQRGALVLFPEGGNFTPERRSRALRKLRRKGKQKAAARAEKMPHVLPPQPSGALAALAANPDADVIFAGHTGLGLAAFPRELWRNMPYGRTLRTRIWLAPSAEIPQSADAQIDWLYGWWGRIDAWIEEQGTEPDPNSAA